MTEPKSICPCCFNRTFVSRGHWEICEVCFWEDDGQDDFNADVVCGGPNGWLSLTKARSNYVTYRVSDIRHAASVRLPHPNELTDQPPLPQLSAKQLLVVQFFKLWAKRYPGILPIGHSLSSAYKSRWMRIHSLPDSKRYPSTDAEWAILLHRQNTLINYLVPQRAPIQMVINWIEPESHLFQSCDPLPLGIIQEAPDEPAYESFLIETTWENEPRNPILIMIADEQLSGVIIVAPDCLIHPYDGGLDVIAKDPHTCHELKRKFKDWLSARPDGL